ncbi:MAG: efflux RND transporter periplasmic adaptor subunit [Deltaproteobacteria bacterium]|nr:MAG: efflux RND transporter periplasmic adaptor subunit [Deltaproteobacteria bacterium]
MRERRTVLIAVAVVVIAAAGFFVYRRSSAKKQAGAQREQAAQAAARAIPVIVAPVQRRDVPIYLDGLGNVSAFYTVTVRSQVDGRLDQVLFREGQQVKKGDLLARIDPRPFQNQLAQAQGALARDKAQLEAAKVNLDRYRQLAAKKLIPQQQADDQAAMVGQLEGAVQVDAAAIASAKLNLDYASIRSPIDGVTGMRVVDPGNLVHASDANGLVVITQLDPIALLFSLPQDELPDVMRELQAAALAVEAWSRDGSQKLATGQLALVDNQINAATATLRLKAVFPNPQKLLWPNQFVKARLLLTTRKDALVVAATVPQRGPDGLFAYVVQQDQTVQPHNIEIDRTEGDVTIVAKGLTEGEQVVVDGQNQLRAGAKVMARQAGQPARIQREGEGPRADTPRTQRGPRQ